MTAPDHSFETICQLIGSCCDSQQSLRTAAETIENDALKRLFGIYAQQRQRFAEELRGFAIQGVRSRPADDDESAPPEEEAINHCLECERFLLSLYRKAVAGRTLPIRAHFLVSAQLALLENAHRRIEALGPQLDTPNEQRIAV
jgi:hypothetical protein